MVQIPEWPQLMRHIIKDAPGSEEETTPFREMIKKMPGSWLISIPYVRKNLSDLMACYPFQILMRVRVQNWTEFYVIVTSFF